MDFPHEFEYSLKDCKEECIFCSKLESCAYIYEIGVCPIEEERNEYHKEID